MSRVVIGINAALLQASACYGPLHVHDLVLLAAWPATGHQENKQTAQSTNSNVGMYVVWVLTPRRKISLFRRFEKKNRNFYISRVLNLVYGGCWRDLKFGNQSTQFRISFLKALVGHNQYCRFGPRKRRKVQKGHGHPTKCRKIKFVVGSFRLCSILVTEGSTLDTCYEV